MPGRILLFHVSAAHSGAKNPHLPHPPPPSLHSSSLLSSNVNWQQSFPSLLKSKQNTQRDTHAGARAVEKKGWGGGGMEKLDWE